MRWNGRQIRNACQTALALAEHDARRGARGKVVDATARVHLKAKNPETVSRAYLGSMEDVYGKDSGEGPSSWASVPGSSDWLRGVMKTTTRTIKEEELPRRRMKIKTMNKSLSSGKSIFFIYPGSGRAGSPRYITSIRLYGETRQPIGATGTNHGTHDPASTIHCTQHCWSQRRHIS